MSVDWETWLVEDAGHSVIQKEAEQGAEALSPAERLTHCLWVADYGMRNAGDLKTAADLRPSFQSEAATLARQLGLQATAEAFELPSDALEASFFDRFDEICSEVADALGASSAGSE
ncbi:MAG: hypothetical protein ABIR08_06080 [Sphingomonas sp.]